MSTERDALQELLDDYPVRSVYGSEIHARAKAALATLFEAAAPVAQAEPVPSGWTLMPAVPTPEIVDVLINEHDVYGSAGEMYDALIAAAQVGAASREK